MSKAHTHELLLHACAQPALPVLLCAAPLLKPMRHLPALGWVIVDADLARKVHGDTERFSILADGASGHFWSQLLGDWLGDFFAGRHHRQFRSAVHDLFADDRSAELVAVAGAPMLQQLGADLIAGRTVDIARFARIFTMKVMIEATGQPHCPDSDTPYLAMFDDVEAIANLGKGS